jgi:hypothetical protein
MFVVPLAAISNQRLSVRLDGALFDLEVKTARDVMTISIFRDAKPVIKGLRCLPDIPLIPYAYLEGLTGNFYFTTEGGAYPHYSRFGATDTLWYVTARELQELRHGRKAG